MTIPGRTVVLVAVAVAALFATPVVGVMEVAGATTSDTSSVGVDEVVAQTETQTPAGNNTTQHENPDAVNEDGDTQNVREWLSGQLANRLSESSIQINQQQYELGRGLLGDSYDGLLGKYVDVTGNTENGTDDQSASQFRKAKKKQRELASSVEDYRTTIENYRQARQAGNETRARRLARQANRIANDLNQTTIELNRTYRDIETLTNEDLTTAIQNSREVRQNITTQQAAINSDLFVETDLSVRIHQSHISFVDPATVTGQLDANGSGLANRDITLLLGEQAISTTTDEDGQFSVRYRPTTIPVGDSNVTVSYLPSNTSLYLASSSTFSANTSQVRPNISVTKSPRAVQFDDSVTVSGRLVAGGTGVKAVPVVITLDGIRLGLAQTAFDGTFTADVRIPASVRNGTRTLRVRLPLEEKALASANATRRVSVTSTATTLRVSVDNQSNGAVPATGRLTTVGGEPIANQRITLQIADESVRAVRTNENGRFNMTVTVPPEIRRNSQSSEVALVAVYDGKETNLEPSRATTSISLAPLQSEGDSSTGVVSTVLGLITSPLVLLGGFVLLVVGLVVFWRQRLDEPDEHVATENPPVSAESDGQSEGDTETDRQLLLTARNRLEAGDFDTAVQTAYAAARRSVSTLADVPDTDTHWECYAACESAGLDSDRLASLRELTETYERAAFAPGTLEGEGAKRAVALAHDLT